MEDELTRQGMEFDNCAIRKVRHVREDGTEEDGYAIYLFKDGVIKLDAFSKELEIHNEDE